jgi:hypothetical protein
MRKVASGIIGANDLHSKSHIIEEAAICFIGKEIIIATQEMLYF